MTENPYLDPTRVRAALSTLGLRPSKGMGQNFLISAEPLQQAITAAEVGPDDVVVEVGPGLGVLTWELVRRAGQVIGVELDRRLAERLRQEFGAGGNFTLVEGDALKLPPHEILAAAGLPATTPYKLVANLPYAITSPLLRHFLETAHPPLVMAIMVQWEVALRMTARPPDMSILAHAIQYYAETELVARVASSSFMPAPAVDSAIILLRIRRTPPVADVASEQLFRVIRAGFSQARKKLSNSLPAGLRGQGIQIDREATLRAFESVAIDPGRRAETLSLEEWGMLAAALVKKENNIVGNYDIIIDTAAKEASPKHRKGSTMRQRTTLGVLSPFLGGFYFGGLLTGIHRAAHQQGAQVLAIQTLGEHARSDNPRAAQQGRTRSERDAGTNQPAIDHPFASELVEGWIVVVDESSVNYLRKNTSPGTPLVTISMYIPDLNCPAVLPDNRGGTAAAVRHLLEHGHTRIAFIGNMTQDDIRQRYEGYQAALRERGIEPAPELLYTTEDNLEMAGRNTAGRIVDQGVNFTALVAGTDLNAIGVMGVLQEAGYRFPDDIAIIGFDDMDLAQHTNPPLTSVRPRFDALGASASQLLPARIAGEAIEPGPRYVATALIQRRSCGCSVAKSFAFSNGESPSTTSTWRAKLLRQLAQLAVYPLVLDEQADPTQVWPGALTMLQALDSVAGAAQGPGSAEIARAWDQVFELTSDLEVFQAMISLLENAGQLLLRQDPSPEARERLHVCIEQLRLEMIRARLASETMRSNYLSNIIQSNYEISLTLLGAADGSAKNLDWLWRTPLRWGCLGLWANPSKMTELVVAGAHSRGDERAPELGNRYAPQVFPPAEYVPPLNSAVDSDILMLIPLRTSTHDWGVLALVGPIDTKLSSGNDPMSHWAALLSAALEREELLASLADQQKTLRQAYERERALANTVRELGSPVIPLLPGVLLVPLVGAIDSERAQQFIEELLHGVSSHNASVVLLDITGVPLVDTQIANSLIQATRAATLLGARVILVGVRPEIAQSIVGLGIELRHMATQPTLAAALESLQWNRQGTGPLAAQKGDGKPFRRG